MKIFISADIEGITGVCHWDETRLESKFVHQMTREVSAACVGANEAGATEIFIKDAHSTGRNIDGRELPINTKLHRNWDMGPLSMMDGIDESFDAVMFVGYHSGASVEGNPLAHTFSSSKIQYMKLNNELVSEFDLNTLIAHYYKVPVVFLSGDLALCEHAMSKYNHMQTVATMEGKGDASISIHPDLAIQKIAETVESVLQIDLKSLKTPMPERFEIEICFKEAKQAYRASFFPGVIKKDAKTILFETEDYMAFLKMFMFVKI